MNHAIKIMLRCSGTFHTVEILPSNNHKNMSTPASLNMVRVWDLPTRAFHWLLAAAVMGSFISVKIGGNAMIWHGRFGYAALTLLLFRLVWGFIGPVHARFSEFIKGPAAILAELRGKSRVFVGHNPLGALSVIALLLLFSAQALFGLFTTDDIFYDGPLVKHASSQTVELASWFHHNSEWFLIGLVALHVLAIVFYRVVKKRDLVGPMVHGDQPVPQNVSVRASQDDLRIWLKALVVLALCAGLVAIVANA
jgi:cytochrome b